MESERPGSLTAAKRVHIVGIGGIGTSALAQWLQQKKINISGSDASSSTITDWLKRHGIPVASDKELSWKVSPHVLIYSDAVPASHGLRQLAGNTIPQLSYAHAIGQLSAPFATLAVAGSHGKSTTTALSGLILEEAGYDPTVVVGTLVPAWQKKGVLGNFRPGKSQYAVIEADEYRNHFLQLAPEVAIVTSLDHDHTDAFPTRASYIAAFKKFLNTSQHLHTVIVEKNILRQVRAMVKSQKVTCIPYTLLASPTEKNAPEVAVGSILSNRQGKQLFSVSHQGKSLGQFEIRAPGRHMVANAIAALLAAQALTGDHQEMQAAAKKVFSTFTGTWRRFEIIGKIHGAIAVSDYAHHPTEIAAIIAASHDWYPRRRLVLVLQAHHHQRAKSFVSTFIHVLKKDLLPTDRLVLTPVYDVPGREDTSVHVDTRTWAKKIGARATHIRNLESLSRTLKKIVTKNDVVIFAGAGSIDQVARKMCEHTPVD